MSPKILFEQYLLDLRETPSDDKTEHTDRPALKILLQGVANDVASDLTVHHETKQTKVKGKTETVAAEKKAAPDFKVTKAGGLILGYVENKAIGEPLRQCLGQRGNGELLLLAEDRANSAQSVSITQRGQGGRVRLHRGLLRDLPRNKLAQYHGKGDNTVEAVRYSAEEQFIAINKVQSFKPVPEDVWNFHIGGYQVLDKYLKSRKGRKLSLDKIDHVAAVANSLAFTIAQMAKIDSAYNKAFAERG